MSTMSPIKKFNAREWVTPEALNVTPDLLGMPLAKPSRRAMAIILDVLAITLLSSLASFWLWAMLAAVLFELSKKRRQQSKQGQLWLWLALLLLVSISSLQMVDYLERHYQTKPDHSTRLSDEGLNRPTLMIPAAATTSESSTANEADPEQLPEETDAARIASLEHELAMARMPKSLKWREQFIETLRSMGLGFSWAIAYFSLLPYWWKGQSLGKRVFGLRVVELTGKPMSIFHNLSRYGGYAAGMATGGIGFLQICWDLNRQAIQDKIAHTVVIDLRQPRRLGTSEVDEKPENSA